MPNKKISQLVNKTSILSTDLFPIGDATTGQLYKKTISELQAAIGGAVISVNGLVGTVVLDTDDIQELASPTNKYFTDARARGAVSATSPLAYNSSTGVFSIPAATTSANGYLTSTDWNTFNGKENVLTFSLPLVRTSNTISIPAATTSANGYLTSTDWNTFNNKQGALTLTVTGSSGASTLVSNTLNIPTYTLAGLGGITASFLSGGTGITYNSGTGVIATTITQYTDALARASLSFTAGSGAYNSTTGVITIPTNTSQLTNGANFITLGSLSGGTGISYNSTTGAISYSGTVYTDSSIRGLFSGNTGISYNSTTGAISSTITQYTDALARAAISLTVTGSSGASTYNSTTGVLNVPTYTLSGLGGQPALSGTGFVKISGTTISYDNSTYVTASSISGTTNYIPKFTSSSAIGNSAIQDNGSTITINQGALDTYATIINQTNTTSNRSFGLLVRGGTSSSDFALTIQNAAASANLLRLTGSGNLGLGVTPSAWSGVVAMQIGTNQSGLSLFGYSGTGAEIGSNVYFNGTNYTYGTTATATKYALSNGQHRWYIASSGTQDTAISFTQAMTLTAGGELLIASTTDYGDYKLQVNGNIYVKLSQGAVQTWSNSGSSSVNIRTNTGYNSILSFTEEGVSDRWSIGTKSADSSLYFSTGDVLGSAKLTLTNAGAATFLSSVTATQFNASSKLTWGTATNGTTGQIATDNTNNYFDYLGNLYFRGAAASNTLITFTSGGNVGIGTSSPSNPLDVNGTGRFYSSGSASAIIQRGNTSSGATIDFNTSTTNKWFMGLRGLSNDNFYIYNQTAGANNLILDASTGAATFSSSVSINGGFDGTGGKLISNGGLVIYGGAISYAPTAASIVIDQQSGGIARIMASGASTWNANLTLNPYGGNILIGTTTDNGERLYISGNVRATGTITANSDIRLKKNLERIENALEKVGQISGYTYNTIYDDKRHGGVIAQEIDEVFPEIVNKGNDGLMGVEYGNISALLIEALKEATNKIKALESKVEALQK